MAATEPMRFEVSAEQQAAWLQEIWAANPDLSERMRALGVSLEIDEEADAVFLTIGPPSEALTESVDDIFCFRLEPETLKIVGVEIWGFSRELKRAARFLAHALQTAGAPVRTVPEGTANPNERLAEDIRQLVAV